MAKANFNLDDFRSTVFTDSLARTNRFEVLIVPPIGLGWVRGQGEFVSLYCEQASLPMLNINSKAFKIFGPAYQRPISSEYGGEGISLTFHVDRDMVVKTFFENWMHLIVDPDTFTVGYQKDYVTKILIRQLDEQEEVTYEVELQDAFPRNMNLMELNNAATNQTHRLNIQFAYRYWKNLGREYQTAPVDIPRQRLIPEIPVVDFRSTRSRQFSPFTGHLEDTPGSDLPISA